MQHVGSYVEEKKSKNEPIVVRRVKRTSEASSNQMLKDSNMSSSYMHLDMNEGGQSSSNAIPVELQAKAPSEKPPIYSRPMSNLNSDLNKNLINKKPTQM